MRLYSSVLIMKAEGQFIENTQLDFLQSTFDEFIVIFRAENIVGADREAFKRLLFRIKKLISFRGSKITCKGGLIDFGIIDEILHFRSITN